MAQAINQNLATLSPEGTPPKSRIRDATSALSIVYDLVQGNQERNRKLALLQGMIGGNPPYSQSALRASGQAFRSNFPSLEGKSIVQAAMTPYYDLFVSGRQYAEIELDLPVGEESAGLSRIVSEEFDRRLKEDVNTQIQAWRLIYDFVTFGRGHFLWEDPTDWHFRQIPLARVIFPDSTTVDTQLWDYFIVRQEVPVHWLWRRIRNGETATSAGWNIQACEEAIRGAVPDDPERGWTDYMRVQQELQDNDLYVSSRASTIKLANLYVREFSGAWSHYIVCENYLQGRVSASPASEIGRMTPNQNSLGAQSGQQFLFKRIGAFKSVDQYLSTFYLDVCSGSVNGLTGLAHDLYSFVMVKDRMLNTVADNAFFRSALIVQAQTADAAQRAAVTLIGNMVVVPPNLSIQNSQVVGDVETTLGVIRDFDARVQNNTGVYRPQVVKPQGNPRTATEAELNYSQAATLTASSVGRFYDQLDLVWKETYRRMAASDSEFRKRCLARGVPTELLTKTKCVRANRVIGAGSQMERRQAIGSLMSFYNQYPAGGQRALLAAVTAAYTDQKMVEELMPPNEMENLPTRHHWEANQENDAISNGSPVVWTPEQNDSIHAQVHLGAAMQGVQTATEQTDLARLVAFCDGVVAHVATTHLPRIEASNPDEAKVLKQSMQRIMQESKRIKGILQQRMREQQASQQRAQQLTVDQQLDQTELQHDMMMKERKAEAQIQLKAAQMQEKNRLAQFDLQSQIGRENAATEAQIHQDAISTMAKISQDAAKTAADIKLSHAKAAGRNGKPTGKS